MVGTTGERLGGGGSPVATYQVATFKISFFSGVKSSDFQWRVINTKQFLERLVWSENGIHSTTYYVPPWRMVVWVYIARC